MSNTAAPQEENNALSSDEKIELRPDGEERFRAAVRAAAKSGPKHREPKR